MHDTEIYRIITILLIMASRIYNVIWILIFLICCDCVNASTCRSDEVWRLGFTPEPSCLNPFPIVTIYDFHEGCFCNGNYVRDSNGKCIPLDECKADETKDPVEDKSTLPLRKSKVCPAGEEWKIGYCPEPSCNDIFPILDYHDTRIGCFCRDDHVRDSTGKCIRLIDCPQFLHLNIPIDSDSTEDDVHICPDGEYYGIGGYPEAKCKNLFPIQYDEKTGCFCKNNYVRNTNGGRCIPPSECPKNGNTDLTLLLIDRIIPVTTLHSTIILNHNESSKEDKSCPCIADDVNVNNTDPDKTWRCEPGDVFFIDWFRCVCNPSGLSANCVLDTTQKCPKSEVYCCQCFENICGRDGPTTTTPTEVCRYGRYCKPGYARNAYGKCIPQELCKVSSKKQNEDDDTKEDKKSKK